MIVSIVAGCLLLAVLFAAVRWLIGKMIDASE